MDLVTALENLLVELEAGLQKAFSPEDMEVLRVDVLGRKGRLAQIMSRLPSLAPADRPAVGQAANSVKERCNAFFKARRSALLLQSEAAALQRFDPSLPARAPWRGSLHPTTLVTEEVCGIFTEMGFEVASGPEVENDYYNFEALNMPPDHPARDMQDTLYISDKVLLRTHTSPVQVRSMLTRTPPLAVIVPGKVYRRDSDLTHTPMFHQIEGLMVGESVTMAHLRGTLTAFVRGVFGAGTEVRFRPSFFPFTEPSAEVDISCCMCGGRGGHKDEPCRVCNGTGWVEILGCGMIDPEVFAAVKYSDAVSGFAFGLGVERVAMLKYGIGDLRMFFENDARFLRQFA
ncbi:phenylalanine--tRNA ligase subunit alpha [Candidatus Desulfovibrio trichonymphae]|uniref:Phenylalanine--tRNA ligase alpha subunit n=1 Tax=Candidatus Desulfovibrio trichonymphae TaxID=1725232 RepID=A0A1J1E314_9BACT|nr:phenylalanine--tRNA ligase subunit alpha [Candidatus Desulfovibrio trichonymphae]BAV92283.1 phenylalanyl-tRNA synthetase subunit alpha [Candidatus Desulfovibrio trichonymphae]GHU91469.1 phenylalanine--tRNA ligase alpha subunit [Deltaproteobacteria bacterium]